MVSKFGIPSLQLITLACDFQMVDAGEISQSRSI